MLSATRCLRYPGSRGLPQSDRRIIYCHRCNSSGWEHGSPVSLTFQLNANGFALASLSTCSPSEPAPGIVRPFSVTLTLLPSLLHFTEMPGVRCGCWQDCFSSRLRSRDCRFVLAILQSLLSNPVPR